MNQLRLQATLGDHNLNVKEGTEVNRKISKIVQVILDFYQVLSIHLIYLISLIASILFTIPHGIPTYGIMTSL